MKTEIKNSDAPTAELHCYETQMVMVLDSVTGEPQRMRGKSIARMKDAMQLIAARPGWEERLVIVKLDCVVAKRAEQP